MTNDRGRHGEKTQTTEDTVEALNGDRDVLKKEGRFFFFFFFFLLLLLLLFFFF